MTNYKLPNPSLSRMNNISTSLSSNMLGCVLEYVKLNTLPTIGALNKKFKRLICNDKKFTDFIEERKRSQVITDVRDVFCEEDEEPSYITALRNKLIQKEYTYYQIEDFITEIINFLLKRFCPRGELDLNGVAGIYIREDIKNLSDALKVNQTLTTLDLSFNGLGFDPENIKNLSDALKVNQTLTTLHLRASQILEEDLIELTQHENLKIIT